MTNYTNFNICYLLLISKLLPRCYLSICILLIFHLNPYCILHHAYSLTDAAVQQVNWDASKVKDKLKRDIEAHVASVRATKLSEVCAKYEVGPSLNSSVCHGAAQRILT
jgi:hypothetical protein